MLLKDSIFFNYILAHRLIRKEFKSRKVYFLKGIRLSSILILYVLNCYLKVKLVDFMSQFDFKDSSENRYFLILKVALSWWLGQTANSISEFFLRDLYISGIAKPVSLIAQEVYCKKLTEHGERQRQNNVMASLYMLIGLESLLVNGGKLVRDGVEIGVFWTLIYMKYSSSNRSMIWTNPFFLSIGGTLLVLGTMQPIIEKLMPKFKLEEESQQKIANHLVHTLKNIEVVKAFGTEFYEATNVKNLIGNFHSQAVLTNTKMVSSYSVLRDLIIAIMMVFLLYFSSQLIVDCNLSGMMKKDFSSITAFLFLLIASTQSLFINALEMFKGNENFNLARSIRIPNVINDDEDVSELIDDLSDIRGIEIEFYRVSFSYSGDTDRMIFSDVSFNIESGESVAIVGRTGTGKSTLAKLIMGLINPSSGTISVKAHLRDGHVVKLNRNQIKQCISFVPQSTPLFGSDLDTKDYGGDFAYNIRYGLFETKKEDIFSKEFLCAVESARLNDYLGDKKFTYHLSGGERQRVGLARAMLRSSKLFVLDEPTSALDTTTESEFIGHFNSIRPNGAGLVVITHRMSTVSEFKKVLFIGSNGTVVSSEDPDHLINSEYQELRRATLASFNP